MKYKTKLTDFLYDIAENEGSDYMGCISRTGVKRINNIKAFGDMPAFSTIKIGEFLIVYKNNGTTPIDDNKNIDITDTIDADGEYTEETDRILNPHTAPYATFLGFFSVDDDCIEGEEKIINLFIGDNY